MPQTRTALTPAGVGRAAMSLLVLLAALLADRAAAQESERYVRVADGQENLRAAPSGTRIGSVLAAAALIAGPAEGDWRQVTLDGWLPESAVRPDSREGHDVSITSGGAPIHSAPGGDEVARGLGGMLLHEVERRDGWVRVRRTAWMWRPSLAAASAPAAAERPAAAASGAANRAAAQEASAPTGVPAAATSRAVEDTSAAAPPVSRERASVALHDTPAGDTAAVVAAGTPWELIGREGDWARVRVEGWVLLGEDSAAVPRGRYAIFSLSRIREDPNSFRGQSVAWTAQFISIQRADSIRSDMAEGEWYMLARDASGEPGLAYVVVPSAEVAALRELTPLQRVRLVARVRSPRSPLTGHPILEMLEIRN